MGKSDFEHRMEMWLFLDKIFGDVDGIKFIWIFSEEDRYANGPREDQSGWHAGVCKGVRP